MTSLNDMPTTSQTSRTTKWRRKRKALEIEDQQCTCSFHIESNRCSVEQKKCKVTQFPDDDIDTGRENINNAPENHENVEVRTRRCSGDTIGNDRVGERDQHHEGMRGKTRIDGSNERIEEINSSDQENDGKGSFENDSHVPDEAIDNMIISNDDIVDDNQLERDDADREGVLSDSLFYEELPSRSPSDIGINLENSEQSVSDVNNQSSDDEHDISQISDADLLSDEDNFNLRNECLDRKLQCFNECTVKEALLLLLAQSIRHNLTYEALIDSMAATNILFGFKYLPTNKQKLWKIMSRNASGVTTNGYCPKCRNFLGNIALMKDNSCYCDVCKINVEKGKMKQFLTLSLRNQLKQFLKLPDITKHLKYRFDRIKKREDSLEDIYDGEAYLRLQEEDIISSHNFTYTFNTDGFSVHKSSEASAWPIFISINELPPNLRQKHMFLAGLWYDSEEPTMSYFLQSFVEEANHLSSEGIRWKYDESTEVTSKFIPTCCVVDSKARCVLLGMTQYNGYYGCTFCNHLGIYVARSMRYPILPHPEIPKPIVRTDERVREQMLAAYERKESIEGIKEIPSELICLNHFDFAVSPVVDDLHGPIAGVGELHTNLLLDGAGEVYYAGSPAQLALINLRMMSIKTPSCVSRKGESIKKRSMWKGSQWRNWIVYCAIPCLQDIGIPQRYIDHLGMLSSFIFLLSQTSISRDDLRRANWLIVKYVELFEKYFGVKNMRYNIHLLLHLIASVINWGPLWAHSTFGFESWNHNLKKCVKSPKGVADQIVTRFLIQKYLEQNSDMDDVSESIRRKIDSLIGRKVHKGAHRVSESYVLGTGFRRDLAPDAKSILEKHGYQCDEVIEYQRFIHNSIEYRSLQYKRGKRSDDTKLLMWNGTYCEINRIVTFYHENTEVCGVFVYLYAIKSSLRGTDHILLAEKTDVSDFFLIDDCRSPLIEISVTNELYLVPLTNQWQID